MFDFINDNNLLFINDNDLKSKSILEGRLVSLYYKFFNQEGRSVEGALLKMYCIFINERKYNIE